jgi:hypothetical protein
MRSRSANHSNATFGLPAKKIRAIYLTLWTPELEFSSKFNLFIYICVFPELIHLFGDSSTLSIGVLESIMY